MTIQLSNASISAAGPAPPLTESRATYSLEAGGDVKKIINGTTTDIGDWITPKSGMSNYECRFTLQSGTAPSGSALGTWLDLTTGRFIYLLDTSSSGPLITCAVLVEIRDKATHTIQASATVNLIAYLTH